MPFGLARYGDPVNCPADAHGWTNNPVVGMFTTGSPDTFVNSMPHIRLGDGGPHVACAGPNTFVAASGSTNYFVNDRPAVRGGDATLHCGLSPGTVVLGMT